MDGTARASMEHTDATQESAEVEVRAQRVRVEESVISQLTSITLLLGPATAVASAAVLTMGSESLRAPAVFAFLLSVAGVGAAHRIWEAQGAARRKP